MGDSWFIKPAAENSAKNAAAFTRSGDGCFRRALLGWRLMIAGIRPSNQMTASFHLMPTCFNFKVVPDEELLGGRRSPPSRMEGRPVNRQVSGK
jgi:hypothetical protein